MTEALANRIQRFETVDALTEFAAGVTYDDLPAEAICAAQIFIMDSLAVGLAGVTYGATAQALAAATNWGEGSTRVIGRPGVELARPSAAFVNGMQIHALEWDGLHELSVVIALCAPMGAMSAEVGDRQISGKALIVALIVAVEVAVFFGGDTSASPRFFRPSAAGGMGAAAGMARLRGYDQQKMIHTLGLAHAQTAGTMQAHWEGSMALPMQIGNAARMAHLCVDMVDAGMTGPIDFVDGQFGYFKLFESGGRIDKLLGELGKPFKITQMAHKPYPAGRATQAALTMIRQLRAEHAFEAQAITRITIDVPPLIMMLVGRPASDDMSPSYARLCLRFIVPLMLLHDDIDPRHFDASRFSDPQIQRLGQRVHIRDDGNQDKNALGPQTMEIEFADGRRLRSACPAPLGSPDNPLTRQQREDKVRRCFALGESAVEAEPFIDKCNALATLEDVGELLDHLC
ncbi:MAG: MmgE/PrpD family protein [Gammaproteobacteria bacterium]